VLPGALLKNRERIHRPRRSGRNAPSRQVAQCELDGVKIFLVVGAKIEGGVFPGSCSDRVEKLRLEQAVFMVSFLWPRIGKQRPYFRQRVSGREGVQKFAGLSPEEMTVGQTGAIPFATTFFEAFKPEINADAKFLRKCSSVTNEKVTVPASNLPDQRARLRQQ